MNESLGLYVDILIGAGESDRFEVGGNNPEMVERFWSYWDRKLKARSENISPGEVFHVRYVHGLYPEVSVGVTTAEEYPAVIPALGYEPELLLAA